MRIDMGHLGLGQFVIQARCSTGGFHQMQRKVGVRLGELVGSWVAAKKLQFTILSPYHGESNGKENGK